MKRTDPESIRQIVDRVLDAQVGRTAMLEHRASYLWPNIVGSGVNAHTTRRYVKSGELHVYIDSAPLKTELEFQKSRIAEAINNAIGADVLKKIVIH